MTEKDILKYELQRLIVEIEDISYRLQLIEQTKHHMTSKEFNDIFASFSAKGCKNYEAYEYTEIEHLMKYGKRRFKNYSSYKSMRTWLNRKKK